MKKIIFGILLIFLLGACSNAEVPSTEEVAKAYQGDFTVTAKAVFGGNEAEMEIAKNPTSITVNATYPGELAGMGIELFDEHAIMTYEGMTQEIKKDKLPKGTAFLLLEELFDELSETDEYTLSTEDGNIIAKNTDFTATLSSEDFSLISAEFSKYATSFTFSNFEFLPVQ